MKSKKSYIYFLSFIEGATVISVEIFGTKIMTPFLGNSLEVWANTLGVTLLFMTLGYYFGGKIQDKNPEKALSVLFGLAAVFIGLMPIVSLIMFENYIELNHITLALLSSIFIIGLPILLITSTSPIFIQYLSDKVENSGKHAGSVFTYSTLGGITFIMLIGLFILPTFGIKKPIIIISSFCFIFSFIFNRQGKIWLIFCAFILVFFKNIHSIQNSLERKDNVVLQYTSESLTGQLKVIDIFQNDSKLTHRNLFINGINQTIIINTPEVISIWEYVHKISMVSSFKRNGQALLLGMGAGSVASELNKLNITADLVDIDSRMLAVAEQYFYYKPKKSKFYVDDARHFLNKNKKQYDLIIIDLLNGECQPSNIFTSEGISKIKRSLKSDGICVFEFQEKKNKIGISAFQSIVNTFLSEGFKVQYNKKEAEVHDYVIVASLNEIGLTLDFNSEKAISQLSSSYKYLGTIKESIKEPYTKVKKPFPHGVTLTDDLPYLDILNRETIADWRKASISSIGFYQLKEKFKMYN